MIQRKADEVKGERLQRQDKSGCEPQQPLIGWHL
jgi:hypothetical protein